MLWEIEVLPKFHDPEKQRVSQELALLTHADREIAPIDLAARGFLLEGALSREQANQLLSELLVDPLVETGRLGELNVFTRFEPAPETSVTLSFSRSPMLSSP